MWNFNREMTIIIYKAANRIIRMIGTFYNRIRTSIEFHGNGVRYSSYRTNCVPYVMVARGGKMIIGENFAMNNGIKGNPIGCYERCTFFVDRGCTLKIGQNVGISQAALVAHADITIGDNVKIGGGVCIFSSDFHSLNPQVRASKEDLAQRKVASVTIKDNAFIGAKSIILKGVTIGENVIVGAGSIVTKSIPDNEIWAGNPASFIRKV